MSAVHHMTREMLLDEGELCSVQTSKRWWKMKKETLLLLTNVKPPSGHITPIKTSLPCLSEHDKLICGKSGHDT